MAVNLIDKLLGKNATQFDQRLAMLSVSDIDRENRRRVYSSVLENTLDLDTKIMGGRRTFSGASVSAANLSGTAIYSGIMWAYVNNIAPIFCVERATDAPKQQLMYVDMYDILKNELIVPNIGPDQAWASESNRTSATIVVGTPLTVMGGFPITPKSFYAEVYNAGTLVGTIQDNGRGVFIATPGVLDATNPSTSTITYNTGNASTFTLTWDSSLVADKIVYALNWDSTAQDETNAGVGKVDYFNMTTEPLLIPVQRNLVADHAMAKQGIINADDLYSNFVQNEYTKAINRTVFDALLQGYQGNTYQIDLSNFTLAAGNWETIVRAFLSALAQGENLIAEQTYKGAKVTGILAHPNTIQVFDLISVESGWIKNTDSTYFNDVAGWLNGVPVVRCDDPRMNSGDIMLTHRTQDGMLAPCFHGIFLGPTELPVIGSFKNITNYATGLYSMEGVGFTSSKLCVKLNVVLPTDLQLTLMSV
jgi:hypothetical protein